MATKKTEVSRYEMMNVDDLLKEFEKLTQPIVKKFYANMSLLHKEIAELISPIVKQLNLRFESWTLSVPSFKDDRHGITGIFKYNINLKKDKRTQNTRGTVLGISFHRIDTEDPYLNHIVAYSDYKHRIYFVYKTGRIKQLDGQIKILEKELDELKKGREELKKESQQLKDELAHLVYML